MSSQLANFLLPDLSCRCCLSRALGGTFAGETTSCQGHTSQGNPPSMKSLLRQGPSAHCFSREVFNQTIPVVFGQILATSLGMCGLTHDEGSRSAFPRLACGSPTCSAGPFALVFGFPTTHKDRSQHGGRNVVDGPSGLKQVPTIPIQSKTATPQHLPFSGPVLTCFIYFVLHANPPHSSQVSGDQRPGLSHMGAGPFGLVLPRSSQRFHRGRLLTLQLFSPFGGFKHHTLVVLKITNIGCQEKNECPFFWVFKGEMSKCPEPCFSTSPPKKKRELCECCRVLAVD